jgi:hypothetical protein
VSDMMNDGNVRREFVCHQTDENARLGRAACNTKGVPTHNFVARIINNAKEDWKVRVRAREEEGTRRAGCRFS